MRKITLLITYLFLCFTGINAQPIPVNWEIVTNPLTLGTLPMTASGQQIWGDYNNDGNLDMFIIAVQGNPFSALYKNNGDGTFTESLTDVTPLTLSSAVFFDYNNDGNLDLLIAGSADGTTSAALTELYKNSGAPDYNFILDENASFVGISAEGGDNNTRLIEAVDYNNDGWVDVFLSGNAGSTWEVSGNSRVVALYRNNHGTFELVTTPVNGTENFVSMNGGGIHCGDVNNDGFADMIVSGYVDSDIQTVTDLYINNGDGTFSYYENSRSIFTGQMQGETFFVDVNNDGYMDIVEVGRDVNNGWANFANMFINNHDLTFTKVPGIASNLIGGSAVVATGDINHDGLTDIAISGWGPNMTFFYNNDNESFLVNPITPDKARARSGCINLVDFDNDGDLDFSIFGYRDGGAGTAEDPTWPDYLLKNVLAEGLTSNVAPSAPTNLNVMQEGENVVLSWDKATDDNTPADALRYNVFIKAKSGNFVYTYFPVDITNGWLKTSGVRPFISGTSITLKGLNAMDYIFGVQAIDNGNMGSAFTTVTTGIDRTYTDNIKIFSRNRAIIISNDHNSKLYYEVLSTNGQLVKKGICNASENKHIEMALPGLYLVRLSGENISQTTKVLIY